ncbi:MAG: phospho-N-acetylmuramoyl-pentapeptide-transferase [Tissierellia bacterium]|nr:phospho-N-acetylmuramoyl-pentapeptide-transferase [Tissierellia bacterium]
MLIAIMLISFVSTLIFGNFLIPQLKKKHIGQNIRQEGPKSHYDKAGTPTMGGVMIILISLILSIILMPINLKTIAILISMFGFGMIGFIDDFRKLVMKRSLGLTAKQKIILQVIISFLVCFLNYLLDPTLITTLRIPIINYQLNIGYFGFIVLMFILIGTVNAVNLTDGLDGLASSVSIPVFLAFIVISVNVEDKIFSTIMLGAIIAFLVYNSNPASVFMGDTGSMAIGGAVSALAISEKIPIFLIILGGVYMFEALSVILQVASYKLRNKKRIFLMSPIHHHFELKGYKEAKIVTNFAIVSAMLSLLTLLIV